MAPEGVTQGCESGGVLRGGDSLVVVVVVHATSSAWPVTTRRLTKSPRRHTCRLLVVGIQRAADLAGPTTCKL